MACTNNGRREPPNEIIYRLKTRFFFSFVFNELIIIIIPIFSYEPFRYRFRYKGVAREHGSRVI